MILPKTPLFQAKTDAEFRIRMIHHIKSVYKDLIGNDVNLLDLPNGLDLLQARVQQRLYETSHGEINLLPEESRDLKIAA